MSRSPSPPLAYAGPGFGSAGGPPHLWRDGPGGHIERLAEELELTADQKSQLAGWREQNREKTAARRQATRELHRQMHELITAETVDEQAIRAKAHELGEARADRAVERAYFMQQVRSILTPDQFEKLQALKAERRPMRKFHRR